MDIESVLSLMKHINGAYSEDNITRLEHIISLIGALNKGNKNKTQSISNAQKIVYSLSHDIKNTT